MVRSVRGNGFHVKGVATGISSQLLSFVVEVAPVDERIMLVRLKHTLGFMSRCTVRTYQDA